MVERLFPFSMYDIIGILGLPQPPSGRQSYYIPCPECDSGGGKHLNIHLIKGVFRCAKCGFHGGMLSLYEHYTGCKRANSYWEIARLAASNIRQQTHIPSHEEQLASPELRDKAYATIFKTCRLRPEHVENLHARGLSDTDIKRLGYCSTPTHRENAAIQCLSRELNITLKGVPGFYRQGSQYRLIDMPSGLMIPLKDIHGRIQGIQIRLDGVDKRYRFLSSIHKEGGSGSKSWVHIAGMPKKNEEVLVTEGALKADVVHSLTGKPVVAVAGVHSLALLEPVLHRINEIGVSRVMIAYDMDFISNEHVSQGYDALAQMLNKYGFSYGTYLWDYRYKGIDDFFNAHRDII